MKEKDLSILVEKYLAAETSLEEEQYLKNQLKSEKNASLYPELVSMFEFFDTQESRISIPEFTDPSAPIPEATQPSEAKYRKLWPALTAAASILILIVAFFYFSPRGTSTDDTFTDPEIAAQNAMEALQMLSAEINKGKSLAKEQMNDLDYLNTFLTIY